MVADRRVETVDYPYHSQTNPGERVAFTQEHLFGEVPENRPLLPDIGSIDRVRLRRVLRYLFGYGYGVRAARAFGVTPVTVCRWLSGERGLSRRRIVQLAGFLEMRFRERRYELSRMHAAYVLAYEAEVTALEAVPGDVDRLLADVRELRSGPKFGFRRGQRERSGASKKANQHRKLLPKAARSEP